MHKQSANTQPSLPWPLLRRLWFATLVLDRASYDPWAGSAEPTVEAPPALPGGTPEPDPPQEPRPRTGWGRTA